MSGEIMLTFILVAIGLFSCKSEHGWLVQDFPNTYSPKCFDCDRDNSACQNCKHRRLS